MNQDVESDDQMFLRRMRDMMEHYLRRKFNDELISQMKDFRSLMEQRDRAEAALQKIANLITGAKVWDVTLIVQIRTVALDALPFRKET